MATPARKRKTAAFLGQFARIPPPFCHDSCILHELYSINRSLSSYRTIKNLKFPHLFHCRPLFPFALFWFGSTTVTFTSLSAILGVTAVARRRLPDWALGTSRNVYSVAKLGNIRFAKAEFASGKQECFWPYAKTFFGFCKTRFASATCFSRG